MKNILLITLIFILTVFGPGCIETQEVEPATVNQVTLDTLGWVQSEDVQKESMNQEIGNIEMVINTAMVTYYDIALVNDINHQINDLMSAHGGLEIIHEANQFPSQVNTIRLALPASITIPNSILMEIIDSQIQNMAQQNNIQDFHDVGTQNVTLISGMTVEARSYEGYIETNDGIAVTINVRGIISSWSSDGVTTIVICVIPAEDLTMSVPTQIMNSGILTVDIDEDREYQDILTLIQNIE
jgi:hypothetical protein